jgi:hypothetical protein
MPMVYQVARQYGVAKDDVVSAIRSVNADLPAGEKIVLDSGAKSNVPDAHLPAIEQRLLRQQDADASSDAERQLDPEQFDRDFFGGESPMPTKLLPQRRYMVRGARGGRGEDRSNKQVVRAYQVAVDEGEAIRLVAEAHGIRPQEYRHWHWSAKIVADLQPREARGLPALDPDGNPETPKQLVGA